MSEHDPVNKPSHYQIMPGVEVYDVRMALMTKIEGASHGAVDDWSRAWEYLTRMWGKNGLEDAKKARWYLDRLIGKLESTPVTCDNSQVTVLPDGSAFAVMSYPLPKDHWLYAEREYEDGADQPKELPHPLLSTSLRDNVEAAARYAVRGATNCGKESDFDPDALVQNVVYALCGPYGGGSTSHARHGRARPPECCGAERQRWRRL